MGKTNKLAIDHEAKILMVKQELRMAEDARDEVSRDNTVLRAELLNANIQIEKLQEEVAGVLKANEVARSLAMKVAGWCYAEACLQLENGVDMRQIEVPDFMAKLRRDIPEVQ